MSNFEVKVCCLQRLPNEMVIYQPSHVVTLLDGINKHLIPILNDCKHFVGLLFDQEDNADVPAMKKIIEELVFFIQQMQSEGASGKLKLLVHCHTGVSRSPAAAYIALCQILGLGAEPLAFEKLLEITLKPYPNLKMVEIADRILGRNSAMIEPLLQYRSRFPRRLDAYTRLNPRRGFTASVKR